MKKRGSVIRSNIVLDLQDDGTLIRCSSLLDKKRPGVFSAGWKTRFCSLQGMTFSWSESEGSPFTLGSLDIRGAVVDGPSLRQGGSDLEAPPELLVITVNPKNARAMELRAANLSDARRWISVLQAVSKGMKPKLRRPSGGGEMVMVETFLDVNKSDEDDELPQVTGMEGMSDLMELHAAEAELSEIMGKGRGMSPEDTNRVKELMKQLVSLKAQLKESHGNVNGAVEGDIADEDRSVRVSYTGGWFTCVDANGGTYYWNESTGQTQWEVPEGFSAADNVDETVSQSELEESQLELPTSSVENQEEEDRLNTLTAHLAAMTSPSSSNDDRLIDTSTVPVTGSAKRRPTFSAPSSLPPPAPPPSMELMEEAQATQPPPPPPPTPQEQAAQATQPPPPPTPQEQAAQATQPPPPSPPTPQEQAAQATQPPPPPPPTPQEQEVQATQPPPPSPPTPQEQAAQATQPPPPPPPTPQEQAAQATQPPPPSPPTPQEQAAQATQPPPPPPPTSQEQAAQATQPLPPPPPTPQEQAAQVPIVSSICQDFKVDVTAASFGVCICGKHKSEHPGTSIKRGSMTSSKRTSIATHVKPVDSSPPHHSDDVSSQKDEADQSKISETNDVAAVSGSLHRRDSAYRTRGTWGIVIEEDEDGAGIHDTSSSSASPKKRKSFVPVSNNSNDRSWMKAELSAADVMGLMKLAASSAKSKDINMKALFVKLCLGKNSNSNKNNAFKEDEDISDEKLAELSLSYGNFLAWESVALQKGQSDTSSLSSALLPLWLESTEVASMSDIRNSGCGTPTADYHAFLRLMSLLKKFDLDDGDLSVSSQISIKEEAEEEAGEKEEDDDEDDDEDKIMESVSLEKAEATLSFVSNLREKLVSDSSSDQQASVGANTQVSKSENDHISAQHLDEERRREEAQLEAKDIETKLLSLGNTVDERQLVKSFSSVSYDSETLLGYNDRVKSVGAGGDEGSGEGGGSSDVLTVDVDSKQGEGPTKSSNSDMSLSDALQFTSKLRSMEREATRAQQIHLRRSKSITEGSSSFISTPVFNQLHQEDTSSAKPGHADNSDALLKLQEMFQAEIESVKRKQMFTEAKQRRATGQLMQTTAELEALRSKMKQMEEQAVIDARAREKAEKLASRLKKEEEERERREREAREKEERENEDNDFFSSLVTTVTTMSREATETASSMFGSLT